MVKRCSYGVCNTDSRYPERLENGVTFIPFPKPKTKLEKCKRWLRMCGRPHDQLNINILGDHRKGKHVYICSKHFVDGKPTPANPDPMPACPHDSRLPARPPPKPRASTEPPRKRAKTVLAENLLSDNNTGHELPSTSTETRTSIECPQQPYVPSNQVTFSGASPLDLLGLAAENRRIKEKIIEHVLINENLRREIAECRENYKKLKISAKKATSGCYSVQRVKDSPLKNNFQYYTGFSYEQFVTVYKYLVTEENDQTPFSFPQKISGVEDMPLQDQLLMVLMKLRLNFEFHHLADMFNMSIQDSGALFRSWINYMFYKFVSVPIWPDREIISKHVPQKFKDDFPDTFVLLDGTEMKVEMPCTLQYPSICYTDNKQKSASALKGLIGIDPRGSFIFVSMFFSGSLSDTEITKQSGLLLLLQQLLDCGKLKKGDGVMVGKGFLIKDEIEMLGLKLYIPPPVTECSQMSVADVTLANKIAAHHVRVQRAISRAKKFKIVEDTLDSTLFNCVNQIWFCCCYLTRFMPQLV